MQTYEVQACWDNQARVWWAESDDLIGLVAKSRTYDELITELRRSKLTAPVTQSHPPTANHDQAE